MEVRFSKYHGAGNDFIAIDNRKGAIILEDDHRQKMCDRHFGIGADGLLEIKSSEKADFKLVYYNSNGKVGSLCGNGSRCAVAFALKIGIRHKNNGFLHSPLSVWESKLTKGCSHLEINQDSTDTMDDTNGDTYQQECCEGDLEEDAKRLSFEASDGIHIGEVCGSIWKESSKGSHMYSVDMKDVKFDQIKMYNSDNLYLDNGSPHHIVYVSSRIEDFDVVKEGRALRYKLYGQEGCNINFVAKYNGLLKDQENEIVRNEDVENGSGNLGQQMNENPKTMPSFVHSDDKGRKFRKEAVYKSGVENDNCVAADANFDGQLLFVRTYERGVENETLACGTGCVAVAIADYIKREAEENHVIYGGNCYAEMKNTASVDMNLLLDSEFWSAKEPLAENVIGDDRKTSPLQKRRIKMPGGNLAVTFKVNHFKKAVCNQATVFTDITLTGSAEHVFDGVYRI